MFFDVKNMVISQTIRDNPTQVSYKDFCYEWLVQFSRTHNSPLYESEINVLSSIFSKPDDFSWFKQPHCETIQKECGLKDANFKRVVYSLRDREPQILVPTEIKGDFILSPKYQDYKNKIYEQLKKSNKIALVTNFEVDVS